MARALLTGRVTDLEHRMHAIEQRFDGLAGQISQFREEARVAHAATNSRIDDLRTEVATSKVESQQRFDEFQQRFDELQQRFDELQQRFDVTDARIDRGDEALRRDMHTLRKEWLAALAATKAELQQRFDETHARIDRGDEETRRYMRVLHEEVLERLKWIQKG